MTRLVIVFFCCVIAVSLAVPTPRDGGSEGNLEEITNIVENEVMNYAKTHELSLELPMVGSRVTLGGRNLDNDELNLKLNFGSGNVEARKKSKIKKAFIPILVFILIKAMILIPLALGILGFKAWNAIQLSFVSFVTAAALAIWKLCTKVNHDHPPAFVHGGFDHHLIHDRSDMAPQMAYNAYAPVQ